MLIAVFDATMVFCEPKFMGENGQARFGLLVACSTVAASAHMDAGRQALDALKLGFLRAARSEGMALKSSGPEKIMRIEEAYGSSFQAMVQSTPWSAERTERAARTITYHAKSKLKRAFGGFVVCGYECVSHDTALHASLGGSGILAAKHVEFMRRVDPGHERLKQWDQLVGGIGAQCESLHLAQELSAPVAVTRPSVGPRL